MNEEDEWLDSLEKFEKEEKARKKIAFWNGVKLALIINLFSNHKPTEPIEKKRKLR